MSLWEGERERGGSEREKEKEKEKEKERVCPIQKAEASRNGLRIARF